MTYADWIARHSRVFGLDSEKDRAMMNEWCNVFGSTGIYAEELDLATTRMISQEAPKFRTDHLVLLQKFVHMARKQMASPPDDDPHGECFLCGKTGLVVVPHPKLIQGMNWLSPFATAAVICSCGLGRWLEPRLNGDESRKRPNTKERPRMLTLHDYSQKVCPQWQEVMQERVNATRAQSGLISKARSADQLLGQLARSFAMPAKGR